MENGGSSKPKPEPKVGPVHTQMELWTWTMTTERKLAEIIRVCTNDFKILLCPSPAPSTFFLCRHSGPSTQENPNQAGQEKAVRSVWVSTQSWENCQSLLECVYISENLVNVGSGQDFHNFSKPFPPENNLVAFTILIHIGRLLKVTELG